jgi:hypothetical protein
MLVFRIGLIRDGRHRAFADRGSNATRPTAATQMSAAPANPTAAALLLARMHGFALCRRNQTINLLPFLLMNLVDARLFLGC